MSNANPLEELFAGCYTLHEHLEALNGGYECENQKALDKMEFEVTRKTMNSDALRFYFEDDTYVTARLQPAFSKVRYKVV